MKKFVLFLIIGLMFSGILFAADGFVVQSVTGKVEKEVSPGKWEAVREGSTLSAATVLNTGLNSNLVVKNGEKLITIKAMQKGTLESLAAVNSSSGIRIGGRISSSTTAVNARGTSNTSTASTRASEAVNEQEWVE
ncbi:MAG: hypothetical protein LBJ90_04455 [Treponema sp.]|jgi:hypothetical protein|nr:hypothetical protein [Treponema sp.]